MAMSSSRFWLYLSFALAALFSFSNATLELEKRQGEGFFTETTPIIGAAPTLPVINADPTTISSSSAFDTSIKTPTLNVSPLSNLTTTTSTSSTSSTSSTTSLTTSTSSTTSETSSTTSTPSLTTVPRSTVIVTVTSNGQVYTSSSTSYSTSTAAATAAASTDAPASSSGPSGSTKSTIIGVTVGIGGAIILAGLGFVAWRLWGKRAPRMDEDEILMAGSNAHGEKLTSSSSNQQFKTTLDQYHAHSGTNF